MAKTTNNNIFKDKDIRKIPTNTTPVGEAVAVFLTEPSTEYDDDGQYFVRLKYKTDSKECKSLIKLIDTERQNAFDEALELLESPKDKKNLKLAEPSYKHEEDDDGNDTGYTVFNFKRKAIRINKKGEVKPVRIPFFDSVGQPITDIENLELWSGSELAIAFRLTPYYTERIGVGVSHRIEAVQIIKAVSGGDGRTATEYGFGKHAGGFASATDNDDDDNDSTTDDADEPPKKVRPSVGDDGDY